LSQKDNIFRLVPNDANQGKEIAKKMWSDGIRLVVPIFRDDSYGNELYNATKVHFEKLGGKISKDQVKYDPHVGKFAASLHRINFIMWDQELKPLKEALENAKQQFPNITNNNIGVYIIAYGEIIPILLQASSHPGLENVRWYGSDGIAKNKHLLEYDESSKFVHETNLVTPLMTLNDTNEKFESLENDTGLELNSYDANAYDALWIAALTQKLSGCINLEKLERNLINITKSYSGASGNITLDENGDRIVEYDFWKVQKDKSPPSYQWKKI
jgi:branched-chain amino acid transport system substrate-binding protein